MLRTCLFELQQAGESRETWVKQAKTDPAVEAVDRIEGQAQGSLKGQD